MSSAEKVSFLKTARLGKRRLNERDRQRFVVEAEFLQEIVVRTFLRVLLLP